MHWILIDLDLIRRWTCRLHFFGGEKIKIDGDFYEIDLFKNFVSTLLCNLSTEYRDGIQGLYSCQ